MAKEKRYNKETKKVSEVPFKDYWKKPNYIFLGISLFILVVGYFVMTIGSWESIASTSISPIVLLIAYLILIPLSIFIKHPSKTKF
jgi:hypothetical protein